MKRQKKTAVIHCRGGMALKEGSMLCRQGCTGCGSCVSACRLEALTLGMAGVPVVSREKCVGCGLCAKACPKELIEIVPVENTIYMVCRNQDKGPAAKALCDHSCIGCGICEKNCPAGAIHVEGCCAVIDQKRCIACGMCAVKCPRGAVRDANGILTTDG